MNEASKLGEAEHFLGQMHMTLEHRQHFVYNLSGFLGAARSVLQYACLEATLKKGGQGWYDAQVTGHKVIGFFKDKRDLNIHQEPVEPHIQVEIQVSENLPIRLSAEVSVIVVDQSGQVTQSRHSHAEPSEAQVFTIPQPATRRTVYKFNDWSGSEDVLTLCRLYLNDLRAIVLDGQGKGFLTP